MIKGRDILIAVLAGFVVTTAGYADMMPVAAPEAGVRHTNSSGCETSPVRTATPRTTLDSGPSDFSARLGGYLHDPSAETASRSDLSDALVLTDRQNSLDLCLYALMGIGLYRSAPWLRRFSLGVVPDWYHTGAPLQVGTSVVVRPDCVAMACVCFVQPEPPFAHNRPDYRPEAAVRLRRISQFATAADAPRGPPTITHVPVLL
jgi:hypothetical protein